MLSEILKKIEKEYKLNPFLAPKCVSMRRHIKLFYRHGDGSGYFVKISEGGAAKKEYLALREVGEKLGPNVPSPLGLVESPPHTAFISPLLDERPLKLSDIKYNEIRSQIERILKFTVRPRAPFRFGDPVTVEMVFRFIKTTLDESKLPPDLDKYFNRVVHNYKVEGHKSPQHGDLTLYNFGLHKGAVIVFDWEDYGKIEFAGYDLATFLLSVILADIEHKTIGKHPERLLDMPGGELVLNSLQTISMPKDHFITIFPFFLFCFLYIKCQFGYGTKIFNETFRLISSLFRSRAWLGLMLGE